MLFDVGNWFSESYLSENRDILHNLPVGRRVRPAADIERLPACPAIPHKGTLPAPRNADAVRPASALHIHLADKPPVVGMDMVAEVAFAAVPALSLIHI